MKRSMQRRVPKHPHKPSSRRLGRRNAALADRVRRAFGVLDFLSGPVVLHPIDWYPVTLNADGSWRRDDDPAARERMNLALSEVAVHGTV